MTLLHNLLSSGVRGCIVLVSLLVSSAAMIAASADQDPLKPVYYDIAKQYAVTEEYYKQFNFEWTDDKGKKHIANLTDRATELNHMIALLREVYTNPAIPGFVTDRSFQKMIDDGLSLDEIDVDDSAQQKRSDWKTVPYRTCPEPPYYMPANLEVKAPINGATALIVELKDDFEKPANGGNVGDDVLKNYIASVQLISKQIYVSKSVDDAENPGYLFNVEARMNKFFIITKGRNRTYTYDSNTKKWNIGTRPFYHMFEEYSPSNVEPIYGVYEAMNQEVPFRVDHNCSSVVKQCHHIGLDEYQKDPSKYQDYAVNLLFFLPDYRFLGDSRRKDSNATNSYQHYTYYPVEYQGTTSTERQPFMFFNKIKARISTPIINAADRSARVRVSWESEYKKITQSKVPERFFIHRVVDGIMEKDPIPFEELEMDQADTELRPDGSMIRKVSPDVNVIVKEKQWEDSRNVSYIIRGRRENSEFSFVESNIVEEYIPGYIHFESLKIRISGDAGSRFDVSGEFNDYTNTIELLNNYSGEHFLRHNHLIVPTTEDNTRSRFKLHRYTGDVTETFEEIGWLDIVSKSLSDDGKYNLFGYTITYKDGRADDCKLTKQFRTRVYANKEQQDTARVEAADGNDGVLTSFVDLFTANVDHNQQPTQYRYQVLYKTVDPDKLDAVALSMERADENMQLAASNIVSVNVPVRDLIVGYQPYTLEQIQADQRFENRLKENTRAMVFEARNNVAIKSYDVIYVADGASDGQLVGKAERNKSGLYHRYVYVPDGSNASKEISGEIELEPTDPSFEGRILLPVMYEPDSNGSLVLRIAYQNGNTYGHRRIPVASLPKVNITNYYIQHLPDGNSHNYNAGIFWEPDNESLEIDESTFWTPEAYRVWSHYDETPVGVEEIFDTTDKISSENSNRVASYNSDGEGSYAPENWAEHKFTLTHAPSKEKPVAVAPYLRMYSRIPSGYVASEDGAKDGYVVSDARIFMSIKASGDNPVLGVDSPEVDFDNEAEAVYYDMAGRRVVDPTEPGIYLEVRGNLTRKVLVR